MPNGRYRAEPYLMTEGGVPVMARVTTRCPYCDTRQKVLVELSSHRPQVILCDQEDVQGCDKWFVVQTHTEVTVDYSGIDDA